MTDLQLLQKQIDILAKEVANIKMGHRTLKADYKKLTLWSLIKKYFH